MQHKEIQMAPKMQSLMVVWFWLGMGCAAPRP
jgi:hypothetical protein